MSIQVFVQNPLYENSPPICSFSCRPNLFSYERFCTMLRFETGAQENSEIPFSDTLAPLVKVKYNLIWLFFSTVFCCSKREEKSKHMLGKSNRKMINRFKVVEFFPSKIRYPDIFDVAVAGCSYFSHFVLIT